MRLARAYAQLLRLKVPVIRTIDAVTVLESSLTAASQTLRRLAAEGFLVPLKRGYWAFASLKDPFVLAEYLSAPYPAYISLQSALYFHGIILQIPRVIYTVSLARTRGVKTPLGHFSIHHIAPEFFCGFSSYGEYGIKIASSEKALLDIFYLQQTQGKLFSALPELDLPRKFDFSACAEMIAGIKSLPRRKLLSEKIETLQSSLSDFRGPQKKAKSLKNRDFAKSSK